MVDDVPFRCGPRRPLDEPGHAAPPQAGCQNRVRPRAVDEAGLAPCDNLGRSAFGEEPQKAHVVERHVVAGQPAVHGQLERRRPDDGDPDPQASCAERLQDGQGEDRIAQGTGPDDTRPIYPLAFSHTRTPPKRTEGRNG